MLDPDEFQIAAYAGFASFNIVKMETVGLAVLTILPILLYSFKHHHRLNVMALGRDHALNLGLDYDKTSRILLILVVLALASATALAGPMMFLGLLVLNITLELLKPISIIFCCPGSFWSVFYLWLLGSLLSCMC